MTTARAASRTDTMRGAVRTEILALAGALVLGLAGAGAFYFAGTDEGGGAEPPPPEAAVPVASRAAARCVSGALPLSRAVHDLGDLTYVLTRPDGTAVPGRLAEDAVGRAMVPFATEGLAEGAYALRLSGGAPPIAFVVDRTPPRILSTEPSLESCPGETLTVRIAPGEDTRACGAVSCELRQDGKPVAETLAAREGGGLACAFETQDLAGAEGRWSLVLRDGAGNAGELRLDWPEATVEVEAPRTAMPGVPVGARATATPPGGEFAVQLLASGTEAPEIRTQTTARGSVADIRFRTPRDSQVVGIDVAYRAAPGCPVVRPRPVEVAVSTDVPGLSYEVAPPSLCGNERLDEGEACDAGFGSAACNPDCTASRCGDGVLNPFAGEQCDGGPGCSGDCLLSCGNGVLDPGEACDDGGESEACNLDCTRTRCGDEITNLTAGEACDDGNSVRGDGCDAQCRLEDDFEEEDPSLGLGRWLGRG